MSRLSEETKYDIVYYATKKGLDPIFGDLCLSREEVDVIDQCVSYVRFSRFSYFKAQQEAPHNVEANEKSIKKKWEEITFTTIEEGHNIMAGLRATYPTWSRTKIIKSETLNYCREMLKEHGFGMQRIRQIIPILTYILKDKEEEFEGLDEWIEEMNKNHPGLL